MRLRAESHEHQLDSMRSRGAAYSKSRVRLTHPFLVLADSSLLRSGVFEIAEVTSRFTDVKAFITVVCSVGFELVTKVRCPKVTD
jgi:hypothetical protein